LNIIGIVHPRGVREVGIADRADILEPAMSIDNDVAAIPVMLDCGGMLAMLMIVLTLAIDNEVAAAAIIVDEEEVIAIVMLAICLAFIPAMVIDVGLRPRPVPASRMDSGRHRTWPIPFAKRLSTQYGKTPFSKYVAYIVSEVS